MMGKLTKGHHRYDTARADYEYLETFAELNDQVELDARRQDLMRDPSLDFAANLYATGIALWFFEHRGEFEDARINEIARRWKCS